MIPHSTNSSVVFDGNLWRKSYSFFSSKEAAVAKKGYELLLEEYKNDLLQNESTKIDGNELQVLQSNLFCHRYMEHTCRLDFIKLAEIIVKHQVFLIQAGLCLIDARPSNYIFNHSKYIFIDYGSFKSYTKQNFFSFLNDFLCHFVKPLIFTSKASLQISALYRGNELVHIVDPAYIGLSTPYLTSFLLEQRIFRKVSHLLTRLDYQTFMSKQVDMYSGSIGHDSPYSTKSAFKILSDIQRLLASAAKQLPDNRSYYDFYYRLHTSSYLNKKEEICTQFLSSLPPSLPVVSIGSSRTIFKSSETIFYLDCEESALTDLSSSNPRYIKYDISNSFRNNISPDPLNIFNECRAAIMMSIVHHIVIYMGIKPDLFASKLSELFDSVLLGIPTCEDLSVKFLIAQKNEPIDWHPEQIISSLQRFFYISSCGNVSATRLVYKLNKDSAHK